MTLGQDLHRNDLKGIDRAHSVSSLGRSSILFAASVGSFIGASLLLASI